MTDLDANRGRTSESTAHTVIRPARVEEVRSVEYSEGARDWRDRVRWGPIIAGLVGALTTLVLLGLLGAAIGLTSVNAGSAAAQGAPPSDVGRNSAIWAAISSLIAFFVGGYITARTAGFFDRGWGAFNGAMVFLVAVPLTLWLAGQGAGAVLGAIGSFAQGMEADPGQVSAAADQARQATPQVSPADVAAAAERARNTAWGALSGSRLGLLSAALGGYFGTRERRTVATVERRTD